MAQHLTLRPWLKKVIYPSFASMDGTSGAIIVNIPPLSPTTVKSSDWSWAPLEAKEMKWPNGSSKPTGAMCQGDPYDHLQLPNCTAQLKKKKQNVFDALI